MLEEKAYINKVFWDDQALFLPKIPDASIPLVVTDPHIFPRLKNFSLSNFLLLIVIWFGMSYG